jgi:hypothetical protein
MYGHTSQQTHWSQARETDAQQRALTQADRQRGGDTFLTPLRAIGICVCYVLFTVLTLIGEAIALGVTLLALPLLILGVLALIALVLYIITQMFSGLGLV